MASRLQMFKILLKHDARTANCNMESYGFPLRVIITSLRIATLYAIPAWNICLSGPYCLYFSSAVGAGIQTSLYERIEIDGEVPVVFTHDDLVPPISVYRPVQIQQWLPVSTGVRQDGILLTGSIVDRIRNLLMKTWKRNGIRNTCLLF